ncbi:MAG TPA: O-antigen ligase family protein [Pyrinomonadaceae bacterium]|nr:O-antigen ligase family protein [Pyrinomonadaceae bacterium]
MPPARKEADRKPRPVEPVRTIASRFVVVTLCLALVLSALAYGTVHYWALAVFELGAAALVVLWAVDAWRSRTLRVSRNWLQLPLLGFFLLGLFQLLPLGGGTGAGGAVSGTVSGSLSIDPYSTRLALVQVAALFVYFAAALAFIDSPKRLRLVVRVVTIFGFALAFFGLIQHFSSPNKIYWLKELPQSTPFGPFYNRHHFAGYMELAMALPLGLLFSGGIERDKRPLYIFAAAFMGIALIITNSRGGLIAMAAEIVFLLMLTAVRRDERAGEGAGGRAWRLKTLVVRAGLAFVMVLALIGGALFFGGEGALTRILGTVNSDDPTTGRAHFWATTLNIVKDHPLVGTGLGSFGLAYTRYDTRNGLYRLEQAHNDYLQLASDAGLVGVALGVFFVVVLFRNGLARRETEDPFRRGVATGALVGCFAVLVHSFFDFTLHTTSNALLFLVLAALATINGRVEEGGLHKRRRRRHRSVRQPGIPGVTESGALPPHGR